MSNKSNAESIDIKRTAGLLDKVSKQLLLKMLQKLKFGHLRIKDADQAFDFGDVHSELKATMTIYDSRAYSKLTFKGSIGAGESYFDQMWDTDNLTNVIRIFAANVDVLDELDSSFSILQKPLNWLLSKKRNNSVKNARKNILAHYDLGNEMYKLFLDKSMMYSSAYYEHADSPLEDAAIKKLDMICQKLQLSADDHVLEIGTGWGGFAIYAAKNYGCRITTTTISEEQFKYANEQIRLEGLGDRITVLQDDYRKLSGQYDKLVSIEMIEAIGLDYYDEYFKQCEKLLKPEGTMLIQAITIADHRFDQAARNMDFIQKYIFPGGALPSIEYMAKNISKATRLQIRHLDDFGLHYAKTLNDWRSRFLNNKPKLISLNFDNTFIRLWEFYLCYCEGAFMERSISVVHLTLDNHALRQQS